MFFAPAHKGAHVTELIQSSMENLGNVAYVFANLIRFKFQSLRDLEKGSPLLTALEQRSEKALASGHAKLVVAKRIVCASQDRVVSNQQFLEDPLPLLLKT